MYLETDAWEISIPSLSNSPWIRGAPQSEFSWLIRRTRLRISRDTAGRPGLRTLDFHVQYFRKPSRCQRTTVSGFIMAFVHSIYFRDPNGYVIELAARTETAADYAVEAEKEAHATLARWQKTRSPPQ